ncbi:MAG: NADP-dependent oxidoreductase [Natronomonas sp.]
MPDESNRQWILTERPTGEPSMENFELREGAIPEPGPNEVLVRTRYLSVDPYMRGRMRDADSYANPWETGDPMRARVVGEVVESNYDGLAAGDLVTGNLYWAEYATISGSVLDPVDTGETPVSTALHVLGMPGLTAYVGTIEVGHVKPGDTVVVSGAAGAVGSVVGQIARIAGCRVVGIAGSDEKTAWLTDDLGFDAAVNYRRSDDLSAAIEKACPRGVDLYFENVGGEVSDAVLDHLTDYSRVAVCGKISLYNLEPDDERMTGPRRLYQRTRTRVEGFIVSDYDHLSEKATQRLARWIDDGELRYRETVTEGIENAPEAFLGLFEGENIGKQLVKVD